MKNDYQDPHIHPVCQWSFIIYETVRSKTSFLNPSLAVIQEKYGMNCCAFPPDYKPDLELGSIIIFPSMLLHFVNSGNITVQSQETSTWIMEDNMEEEKVIKSEPNAKYGNELLLDNIDYIGQPVGDIITRLKRLEQRMDAVEVDARSANFQINNILDYTIGDGK